MVEATRQEADELLVTLERQTERLLRLFEDLPTEARDWRPLEGANSSAALVTHTLGASRYWLCAVAGAEGSDRDRAAEFRAVGVELGDVRARAARWLTDARRILGPMRSADLDGARELPPGAGPRLPGLTARGAVLHVIDHIGTHIGHLELTAQLWRERAGN